MKLSRKYGLFFAALSVVLALILSAAQVHWIDTLVIDGVSLRMKTNIRAGWVSLASRERALDIVATFLARDAALRSLDSRDPELTSALDVAREDWRLDFLGVLDPGGRVLARAGGQPAGSIEIPKLVESIRQGVPLSGFALIPTGKLVEQGLPLPERCGEAAEDAGMLLFVARPIFGSTGRAEGAVVAAILLNCAYGIVDEIQEQLFEDEIYEGHRVGTATIFMGRTRIATTVLNDDGRRAIGTTVSDEVAEQTLGRGEPWTGRAWVVNDWYLSRYEPIRDPEGSIIGMLYIGELERIHEAGKRGTLYALFGVLLAVMTAGIVLSYFISRPSFRQLEELEQSQQRFAAGALSTRAEVRTKDEIGEVAAGFNDMATRIEESHREVVAQREAVATINRNYLDMFAVVGHRLGEARDEARVQFHRLEDCGLASPSARSASAALVTTIDDLDGIIRKYHQLARIEAGELAVEREALRVAEDIVQPVVHDLRERIKAREVKLNWCIRNDLVVMADEEMMLVVLDNLIGNAVRYGALGGHVVIEAERTGDEVIISVWNDGESIPPTKQASLFRKLHRFGVDDVLGRRGAGLGLYISAQIVAHHGGRIWVESAEGEGTRFSIALPV